jgi:signal transduction histidine kinase/CheY-like chemotaxis protein
MGRAVVEGHPVSSSDVANDPRLIFSVERQRQLADSQGARSVLAVPLRAKTVIIGGLLVGDEVGREFSGAEMSLLQAFADQAALALDNARLYEEAARRRREAETLVRIAGTLTESLDSSALGEHIVQSVLELLGARTATLRLLEADGSLRAIAIGGAMRTQLTPGHVLPSGIGIVALAISKGGPVSTRDELTDPRIRLNDELRRASSRTGTSALVAVPLRVKGRTIGTLNVGDAAGRAFSEPEIALLQAFADQAALAVDNARLYEDALDAYRQLSETQAQLVQAQKMEAVGQLTGGVAHDFNNLLTVILGNLGYVDERHPELETWVKPAIAAAERGAELTQRLLAFARRQMLHPRVIDVNRLMDGVGVLLRRTLSETIALESVRAAGLWSAEADPGQLENALLNLALNARDAMPDGGTLTIETANAYFDDAYAAANPETSPGQYVMIGVTDTGTGMEPDVVQRAFEPFFTTKGVGKGSGLGLSMVYGFARQSGGHVKIYSEVGQGTTVRLYLPRARGAEPGPEKQPAAPSVSTGHERILVVEDDAHVRTTVGGLLTSLGYRVVAAATAQDALARLEDPEPIDLLFTDVVLPGGANGAQLAEAARARRPGLKVLFTSGYTANAVGHQGRLDEGVQLLSKPYRKEELARKIRQVLDAPS